MSERKTPDGNVIECNLVGSRRVSSDSMLKELLSACEDIYRPDNFYIFEGRVKKIAKVEDAVMECFISLVVSNY